MNNSDKKFYSAQELIKASGFKLGIKMLDYLRYHLRLLPEPIKYSKGRGLIAVYPHCVLGYFKRIMEERNKGVSLKAIREVLAKELKEVNAQCDYIRRQVKLDRENDIEIRSKLRSGLLSDEVKGGKPDVLEIRVHQDIKVESTVEVKIEELKKELKSDFLAWDGQSVDKLSSIRGKIDTLESLQSRERVLEAIKSVV